MSRRAQVAHDRQLSQWPFEFPGLKCQVKAFLWHGLTLYIKGVSRDIPALMHYDGPRVRPLTHPSLHLSPEDSLHPCHPRRRQTWEIT